MKDTLPQTSNNQKGSIGIFYFSGTGATAYLAHYLGAEFESRGWGTTYIRLTRLLMDKSAVFELREKFSTFDIVAFGAPLYAMRAPRKATHIIKHLTRNILKAGTPFFVFATAHGDWGMGNIYYNLYKYPARMAKGGREGSLIWATSAPTAQITYAGGGPNAMNVRISM